MGKILGFCLCRLKLMMNIQVQMYDTLAFSVMQVQFLM